MTDPGRVTVLIADDEPLARAGLRHAIQDLDWLTCIGEAASGLAALESIRALTPDLLFLDIAMPGLSGLDVMRQLDDPPYVVFTTAHAEHAVTAFELGAIDYLLKPFGAARLHACLDRVRGALGEPRTALPERIGEAFARGPLTRIFVRRGRAIVPVPVESIDWLEAVGDYVALHVGREQHLVHVPLSHLIARLDARQFVRIHRTHAVNLTAVRAFRRPAAGGLVAELRDGTSLAVSRSYAQQVRRLAL